MFQHMRDFARGFLCRNSIIVRPNGDESSRWQDTTRTASRNYGSNDDNNDNDDNNNGDDDDDDNNNDDDDERKRIRTSNLQESNK